MSWTTATRLLLTQPLPMVGWAVGDLLLRSTLLLVGVLCLRHLLMRRSAALRHVVGLAGLAALVALPLVSMLVPASISGLPSLAELIRWLEGAPIRPGARAPILPASWLVSLGATWLSGAVWMAIRQLRGRRILEAIHRRAVAWPEDDATTAAHQAHGLDKRVPVRVSAEIDVPLAFGIVQPRILLPTAAQGWRRERLELVLLHELAHVRRRDLWAQALGVVACCLYWFHPLAWRVAATIGLDREQACDDLVLGARGDANGYARLLVAIADAVRARPPVLAMPMARPSQLTRRLQSLLDESRDRRTVGGRQAAVAALLATAVLLPFGAASSSGARGGTGEAREPSWSAMPDRGHGGHTGHTGHRSGERDTNRGHRSTAPEEPAGGGHGGDRGSHDGHHASGRHESAVSGSGHDGTHESEPSEPGSEAVGPDALR